MTDKSRWHPCFLPDNYQKLVKRALSEVLPADSGSSTRSEEDSDMAQEVEDE